MLNLILLLVALALVCLTALYIHNRSKEVKISGKVALVTGGSNGLGQQICIELAKNGCNVVIADVSPADETLKHLKQYSIKAVAFKVDVSNFDEITTMKSKIYEEFGKLDILINNAGLISYKTLQEQSSAEIERLFKVNVNSVTLMTKCFLDQMIENKSGHILSISSLQGIYAFPYSINYSATKFAVTGFMLGLKEYLRRNNLSEIETSCIHPHIIATRDDVTSIVNPDISVILTPNECAKVVVNAIKWKKSFVTVPEYFSIIVPFFNALPFFAQHFIRDYFQREHLFLKNSKKM